MIYLYGIQLLKSKINCTPRVIKEKNRILGNLFCRLSN